jgi:hypothetical protein
MTNVLIGAAVSLGASALSALFAPSRVIRNKVERNKQDNFTRPRASEGDSISKVWGQGRVGGILLYADFPPEERVSESVTRQNQGGKGGGGTTTVTTERTYTYWGSCAYLLCGKTTQVNEIRFNSKLVWKNGQVQPILESSGCTFRIYHGDDNQQIDSLLQVKLNNLAIPYRHRTILVCEDLPLAEFGNAYPQCSALVRNGDPSLADVINDLCLESPFLLESDLDTSELDNILIDGYQIDNQSTIAEQLTQLQNIHFFDLVDNGLVLKFQNQFRSTGTFLMDSELGAFEEDGERPNSYQEEARELTDLPTQIEIKYFDKNNNLLEGIARSVSFPTATHINRVTIDYPGVLSESDAKNIANKLLWIAWTRSKTQTLSLPPKYSYFEPGDIFALEIAGRQKQVQITQIEIGANYLVLAKTWTYNSAVYGWDQTLVDEPDFEPSPIPDPTPPPPTNTPLFTVSPTILRVLDIPLAYSTDTPGLYAFADGDANWRNANLYISTDLGVTYNFVDTFVTRSILGTCQTIFNGTTVSVRVPFHASLASISEALFLEGRNRSLIGAEIVDFQNATLTGNQGTDKIFELSAPFTRGINNTPQTHAANETFYLLSGYKLNLPAQRSDIGKTFYFKAVSPGQTLADVAPVILVFQGKAFQVSIDDFSPRQGAIGVTVTISGMGFTGATAVSFNEIAAQSFTVVSDTTITAVVAVGTTTGKIRVTAPLGVGESAIDFTIVQPSTLTVQEEGIAVSSRQTLNFIGGAVTAVDNPTENRTDITVVALTVQEEGTAVSSRQTLNFIGDAVTAVDNPTENRTDITVIIPELLQSADGDLITRHFDNLNAKPYFLDVAAPFSYRIDRIALQSTTGNANGALEINGAPVSGLSNLAVSTSLVISAATANNFVTQGAQVRFNVASSSATDVGLTLHITKFLTGSNEDPILNVLKNDLIWGFEFRSGNNVRKDVKTNSNLLSQNGNPSLTSGGILDSLALSGMNIFNNLFYPNGTDEKGDFRRTHTIAYLYRTPASFTDFTADFVLAKDEYFARREANQLILRVTNPERLVLYYEYMRSGQNLNFDNNIQLNTWYLFISKYNANNLTVTGKLNNVLSSTETFSASPPSPFNIHFYIGARRNENLVFDNFTFQGRLQYIYRWNRLTTNAEDDYLWNNGNFRFLY